MAAAGAEEDDGGIPLDVDSVHTLLHVEREQIQMQTVTNLTNVQLPKEASCKPIAQASSPSQNYQLLPASVGQRSLNPLHSKPDVSTEEEESSSLSQTHMSEFKISRQPNTPRNNKTSPQPPPMVQSDVHAEAHAVARSRLEKARVSVQGHIQQAITLFADKEISEWQAKRKQRALRILQPAVLEEFLGAVEGLGGFCSGHQLQDLILLSESVRTQWEEVISEMGAFLPILWSKIRESKQPFSVVESQMHANVLHAATDQTDHEYVREPQALTEGAALIEDDVESLQELCERLTPIKTACQASNQRDEPEGDKEKSRSQHSDSTVPADSRGLQHRGDIPQSDQHGQTQIQAVIRVGDTVEPKQEVECTIIPQADAPPQEEDSSGQEAQRSLESLKITADMMESADDQVDLITQKLDQIIREPVDISSLTLADVRIVSELQEMRMGTERGTEEEKQDLGAISPSSHCQTPHNHLNQLRQQLERVLSAAQALEHFLATLRQVKAEIPVLLVNQQRNEAVWEQERRSWQEAMQRLQMAGEQSDGVDSLMKAVGMTLIMEGAKVTCGDVVASFAQQLEDVDEELTSSRKRESKESAVCFLGKEPMQEHEEMINPVESCQSKTCEESPRQQTPSGTEQDSGLETRRKGENEESQKAQTCMAEDEALKNKNKSGRSTQGKKEGEERERRVQRRFSLLVALREIQGEAEQLGLQEPTLPALQQRTRVLLEHKSRLAGLLSKLQDLRDAASQSGVADFNQIREVEDLWEETKRAVNERMDQCCVLMELLKRFQSTRGELNCTLQRAEGAIKERASYLGKENLQRRHVTIQETKAELSGLGAGVDDFRIVCRQLQTHLRQIPECTLVPFEEEADALMDRWLDVSERTDSHLDNIHLSLTLWEGVLQLGLEVENWTVNKLDAFAQSSCFQNEEDIKVLQNEIQAQEENMERFHRRAAEIQALLQSTEAPLELQVVESHTRKKIEQVKELFSEAEDVFRQMVLATEQVAARMVQCQISLQKVQDSLVALNSPDAVPLITHLKDITCQLQSQEEQVDSLLEDVLVMASIASPENMQSLAADAIQLQEKLRAVQQLLCQAEEESERDAQALHRLQWESERFGQWLQAAEENAAREEDLSLLQDETLQQREGAQALSQLVSSLQSSRLQQSVLVGESLKLLERYHNFQTNILVGSTEKQSSLIRDTGMFQAQENLTWGPVERRLHGAPGVCSRLGEGVSTEEHCGRLLLDCHRKLTSLQENSAGFINNQPALETLLQEATDAEQSPSNLEVLKVSVSAKSPVEAQVCLLSRQVSSLQNHKGAVESCTGEVFAQAEENRNQKVQLVREEATCVQTAVKELIERLANLRGKPEVLPDISQLRWQWYTIQDSVAWVTELAAKLSDLQKTEESSAAQETLGADAAPTVDAVAKDLDSLRTIFLQKKQECADNTANKFREAIRQLQQWSQTERVVPPLPSQETLDEGLGLQRALQSVLSEGDFLLMCLGTKLTKKLEKKATNAITTSTTLIETLSKCLLGRGQSEVELDLVGKTKKNSCGRESESLRSAQSDFTVAVCPPAPHHSSATDVQENSESDRDDTTERIKDTFCTVTEPAKDTLRTSSVHTDGVNRDQGYISVQQAEISAICTAGSRMETANEDALVPNQVPHTASLPKMATIILQIDLKQQPHGTLVLEPLQVGQKDDGSVSHTDSRALVSALTQASQTPPVNNTQALTSDSPLTLNSSLEALQEDSQVRATTSALEIKWPSIDTITNKEISSAHCVTSPEIVSCVKPEVGEEILNVSVLKDVSEHLATKPKEAPCCKSGTREQETLKSIPAHEQEESCEDVNLPTRTMFNVVLDKELPMFHPEDREQGGHLGDGSPDVHSDAKHQNSDISSTGFLKASQVSELKAFKIPCTKLKSLELKHNNSSSSRDSVAASDTAACPGVKQEETTDLHHMKEQMESSVPCSGDGSVHPADGDVLTETLLLATDAPDMSADAAKTTCAGNAEVKERENTDQARDPERTEHSNVSERKDDAPHTTTESESKLPASLEDAERTQGQIQEGMEPERRALGPAADQGTGEGTGGSRETLSRRSTMLEMMSDIQGLVEKSNIINRTQHIDLNRYLESSPGQPEIQLVRTLQRVLACRYQPAQLNVTAMAKQLKEAEDYKLCVLEQIAAMSSMSAAGVCDPDAMKAVEAQCSAALLDASATVQVKAAQLDQVSQYHRRTKMIRALLEVLASEKEKTSLDILGSSVLQAQKLQVLLQTMEQKKGMMEELLQLSSEISVHLSDTESSGALLAQLGDIHEEWRLLEGSIKRAHRQASNAASQSSLLIKDAKQLQAKMETLLKSNTFLEFSEKIQDSRCSLELICLITDLKLYSQLYLHLQSQSDALGQFSLGRKEKDEVERVLQELRSLLNVTRSKIDTSTYSTIGTCSAKFNMQLRDLVIWAKQAEIHISVGTKLALFPEEARIQIAEMRRIQTDILSRRSKLQVEVDDMKAKASCMDKEEHDQVHTSLRTIEDLYDAIADSSARALDTMEKTLQLREKLFCQLAHVDAWLRETHATRDHCSHVENVSKANIRKLESELRTHKLATAELERQLELVDALTDSCEKTAVGLSPSESRYLVNRLSGLWTELDGLLAHERATCWELDELIHERTISDEELSTIQASLKRISTDLDQQRFPLTKDTVSIMTLLKHMLIEHQWQVQELQHCQEAKRNSLLFMIGELQDRCKTLIIHAHEQDKYLHLQNQMEESRDIVEAQIQQAKDETISVGERFRLCQTLLVELALVKTQCQEAADQLEAISQELYPAELNSERQMICCTVETLVSWEHSLIDDIKILEGELLGAPHFCSELPGLTELFQRAKVELEGAEPVTPDEKTIDDALRRYWVIWRNAESGMRILEALRQKEKMNLRDHKELRSLIDATMQACHSRMDNLSHARESLKDYHWAAQGAIGFLHNAEATFLSAPGGFLDCLEEQKQTEEAIATLEDGFQAHISHLVELVPQQPCLSRPKMEQLHIVILSQLMVGRAVLEAQAQLRLESLQRCAKKEKSHRNYHEEVRQLLSQCEARLSECAAEQVTSYDKCLHQQNRAKLLMEDLHALAGKIEELTAGCPMQSCGVGKDGELGALWRRWVSLRRGVGLLMAHSEQRGEEWRDITTSMEQCCSVLATLRAEVFQSSASFTQGEPQELLNQAEMHQTSLEQEQQALASLEHRLEHALSSSCSQDRVSPGPVGRRLVKIQEDVRSLKEKNLLVVAAAQREENERQQVQEEMEELEQHLFAIRHSMEACWEPCKQQELRKDLSSQKAKLWSIVDSVRNRSADEIPADVRKQIKEVQLLLQRAEDEMAERSDPIRKLSSRVSKLGFGLERVMKLLEQQSPTVTEAQKTLKHVWDELDAWHSRLTLVECEVQDLAEEQPDQAQLLMDQLTQPLQLYQNAAQMAEHRTAFLSKIPACLDEFEDILYSATCWLDEALPWLTFPCTYTTAKNLQSHANSLQLVLDDSERIRATLRGFRSVLGEISAVCDISTHEERLNRSDQQICTVQRDIVRPLEQLLQAVPVVDAVEAELKTMEKNVTKIRMILSSLDNSSISLSEHLHNRQVILANVQSMQSTLGEMERCRGEIGLPQGAEESLVIFSRAKLLLQQLQELDQLTQQQAALLENKIRREEEEVEGSEESSDDLGIITVGAPNLLGATHLLDGSLQENFDKEALELSTSEEEEEEEEEEEDGPHSWSSDTLTCSIPEDPEDMLQDQDLTDANASDVQHENNPNPDTNPHSQVKALESSGGEFCSKVETSPIIAETGLISLQPEFDTKEFTSENVDPGLATMESRLKSMTESSEASGPETVTAEPRTTAAISASEEQHSASAMLNQHGSQKHETVDTETHASTRCHRAVAAVEDTRFIPLRPITPFTPTRATVGEFVEDEHLCSSTGPHQHLEQNEDEDSHCIFVVDSHQPSESSEMQIRMTSEEEEDEEQQRWSRFYYQISQTFTTLKKVQDEHQTRGNGGKHEKVPETELEMSGSAAAVIRQAHESIISLRQLVSSADGSHPGVEKELYEGLQRVLLCLDALTDLLLTSGGPGEDAADMKLLQHECVSAELVTLAGVLSNVESEAGPTLQREEPEALRCLSSIQGCLRTVQLVLASSQKQLLAHLGLAQQHQEISSSQICVFDEFVVRQCETFPSLKDAPSLECALSRHLTFECPETKVKLLQTSQALLQGIARILEVGEESATSEQTNVVHNRSQIQAILQSHKKVLRVLVSQLSFIQHLFKREPEALKHHEFELAQLEIRAKALQQQALEQEVDSHTKLQDWSHWEDDCCRLGRMLDELETFISCGRTEGEEEEEEVLIQQRLHACQDALVQLDQSRATLGSILDQEKVLQTWPAFAASVYQAGGALELRWRGVYRRAEQEIQHCRDIQGSRARFQTDSASVGEWLDGAKQRLEIWSDVADAADMSLECVQSHLIKLLDFSMEMEARSVQRATASKFATLLLRLREADCPGLRAQLAQLEMSWIQLACDLSKTQDRLQQRVLAGWPPLGLLSEMEDWLKKQQSRLCEEKEIVIGAKDAAQFMEVLQHYQEIKVGIGNGQLLLDFLCQSGPRVVGADIRALHSQCTMFAERLGALRLQWLHLQGALGSQVHAAEQMHRTCADRERRLQHLHRWTVQQKEKLKEWTQPTSLTLACKALLEQEAVADRVKEVTVALQELRATRVHDEKEEELVCDVVFAGQAESVEHDCADISQQLDALGPALQQTVEEWSHFEKHLSKVSSHATRMRCAPQHRAPLFSLKQAEERMDLLQGLKETAAGGEELWAAVDKSYQSLVRTLHHGTAYSLADRIEEERQRWKDAVQEVEEELAKTEDTLLLWQDYIRLSDHCSPRLQDLRRQWEALSSCSSSHRQDAQAAVQSVEKLQNVTEDVQRCVGDAFVASQSLIGHLEPLAAKLIQSETGLLSHDVLLLSRALSGKKICLQEDLEQQEIFHTCVEVLENKLQDILHEVKASMNDTNSVKQILLELSDLLLSLLDVSEMSGHVSAGNRETERLRALSEQWMEGMTRASDINREIQSEQWRSQNFQQKCKNLTSIQEKLQQEAVTKKPHGYSDLQERLAAHQRLQTDILVGQQLLQSLLCDAVESLEKETGEEKSELMAEVLRVKESWFTSVALVEEGRVLAKEQLSQWRIYHRGKKILWKLLRNIDSLLPPTGSATYPLQHQRSCVDQCVEETLHLHDGVYTLTLEAGRQLCESATEFRHRSHLQSELQAVEEAWDHTTSLLGGRRAQADTAAQKWSECQAGIDNCVHRLDELKMKMKRPLPDRLQHSEEETFIQETELSLEHLASGLRELATMKTDLSQYVAAGDSALLEQQLDQLHCQWEELCMKVSLRRQEIADRLNAWTIFNDKNKELCDWLTQMENKVCHSGDLRIEEMVEKLKKDCMEEINLFSENKSHLKQLGEQLLLASDEAKQTRVRGSLQEVNQRWNSLFHHIESRVKKLKETLVTVQQLDKNMSNLRSWLSRIEAELSRPITYSFCHHQEIQRRLAEQQELQRDIEQHTQGVASVLSLCDVLLRDEDAAGGTEEESDSLQETSRSLDQRWRTICAMALDRRLRIEETWRLWCKFLDDYSRFEDWLKMAERTAANPNSSDVLYTVAKEELKKFEGFQRQVHERLTQLELIYNQYRRLARENRTDRASHLKAMVHEGNRRWDTLHRRVGAVLRRLKHFTSQREDFESTRESMLVWLTELDLQLTNVEHFSESDIHHKIQQLNGFQKEITLNTERIDGLIVFGEGLIQKSSPEDAALIEDELEELHSYCQEVFSRLVRFHQRLSQPVVIMEEPELSASSLSVEGSLGPIGRSWLGRSRGSLPATPTHLLSSPLERSGRETPVSVDSLPLEWDHTGDVGGSSSHEDEVEEEHEEEGTYFSALSEVELTESQEEFVEAQEALGASSLVPSRSMVMHESQRWQTPGQPESELLHTELTLTSTPLKQGYMRLMSQCSGSIENIKRVSMILDDEEQPEMVGLTGLSTSDKQSGVIERWELLQAQSRSERPSGPDEPQQLASDLDDVTSWLGRVIPELQSLSHCDPVVSIEDMTARAKHLKEMEKEFSHYKSIMLSVNLRGRAAPELQRSLENTNRSWSRACAGLQEWDSGLRKTLIRCQEFHETLHSLLLWLAHAESRLYAVDISHPHTPLRSLRQHRKTLTDLQEELRGRQAQQASLQALWSQLQPEEGAEDSDEAQEKLYVTGGKLKLLLRQAAQDLSTLQRRLECESVPSSVAEGDVQAQSACKVSSQERRPSKKSPSAHREKGEKPPRRSFFYRVLRAAFPLHLLLLLLLLLPCLIPLLESDPSCTVANNFARSFYPMLRYNNGPPPT